MSDEHWTNLLDDYMKGMSMAARLEEIGQRMMRGFITLRRVHEALHGCQDEEQLRRVGMTEDGEGLIVSRRGEQFVLRIEPLAIPEVETEAGEEE
jgi:hypothetical protein